jgi:hypothetical protein
VQPKAKPKAKSAAKSKAGGGAVRVRMYRQGLGDCFLLRFPRVGGGDFSVLIDCGVILGTPHADELMKAVVGDIARTTGKKIDVLVATHEHWDHLSGFDPAKDLFAGFRVGQAWLAWTEDPDNDTANRLRQQRAHKLAALWLGVRQMKLRFGAAGGEAQQTMDRAAAVLGFFGIDVADEPPSGGFGAAAAAATGKTADAMKWVREKTPAPKFLKPGNVVELAEASGVRVYVLGPPMDQAQLFKDLPTRSGHETYEEAKGHLAVAERAFFGAAFGLGDRDDVRPDFDRAAPFEAKYKIGKDEARNVNFFREHYLGTDNGSGWRTIEGEWTGGASEFALQLDSDTNNTSLALAFELPDERVLLFPGDAQVGNWESWHADAEGKKQVWKVGSREVTAEQLLNRTVLYKVGHHGSHNATLREKGLEMMTDPDLVALVPVDVYIAHEKKKWLRMPFDPLMSRLADVTRGRVVQADEVLPASPGRASGAAPRQNALQGFLKRAQDSKERIKVEGKDGKTLSRPLYVEYTLP